MDAIDYFLRENPEIGEEDIGLATCCETTSRPFGPFCRTALKSTPDLEQGNLSSNDRGLYVKKETRFKYSALFWGARAILLGFWFQTFKCLPIGGEWDYDSDGLGTGAPPGVGGREGAHIIPHGRDEARADGVLVGGASFTADISLTDTACAHVLPGAGDSARMGIVFMPHRGKLATARELQPKDIRAVSGLRLEKLLSFTHYSAGEQAYFIALEQLSEVNDGVPTSAFHFG
jgi:hypothetical protein